jgi:hypothetical protein
VADLRADQAVVRSKVRGFYSRGADGDIVPGREVPMLAWAVLAGALGAELRDLAPETDARPVLLVVSPGFGVPGFLPLAEALRADGHDVLLLEPGCGAGTLDSLAADVAEAAAKIGPDVVVVAHGVGASVVLAASPAMEARRLVLLGPVLAVWPVASTSWLAERAAGATSADLSASVVWNGQDLATVLLGSDPPPLGCAPPAFAAEVASWVRRSDVPIALAAVDDPVWIAVSAGDDVAAVEAVVPASRAIPDRELVRLGINRLDPEDYAHGEMLRAEVPVRAAVRAAR